jgi:endoglucanase
MDFTSQLLKELTEASGIPGYEAPIREIVRNYLNPFGPLSQDKIGSVICTKKGELDAPRIMLAGHMDEIGFMVKHISKDGFIKFLPLGGWFDQVLLGQRVTIQTSDRSVIGVIGAKPPHMLTQEDRRKVVEKKDMYIDIGALSKTEVDDAGIKIGDPIIPLATFTPMINGKTYLSKAFDDRVGVAMIVSALRELKSRKHPNTIFGVATVQEEIGVRGASTSVHAVDPDVAIVLEVDIAGDVPGIKAEESSIKLGGGPTVLIYDARMVPNLALRNFVIETANEINIPIQLSYVLAGATDGAAIHLHKTGVPTVVLGIPSRHIHSHSSMIYRDDYDKSVKLLVALLERLDLAKVNDFSN